MNTNQIKEEGITYKLEIPFIFNFQLGNKQKYAFSKLLYHILPIANTSVQQK